ncbi:zinc-dependent metalloprotease [Janibacter anophelis]|uniref:zinc-dependent metalloprotease n=1 Tax=Janibacter anophelis TaxID=319054 RepID=UPI000AB86758|nr:zinc-dependent metalloprotease [Janibacter anophelis]
MSNDPSTPSGSPGDDGLPPEIMKIFRDLNGGRDLPPQLVEQLKAMGMAHADPAQVAAMTSQIQSMFAPGAQRKGVDVTAAVTAAQEQAESEDHEMGERERGLAEQAVRVASMWLDQVTDLEAPALTGAALSRSEWIEATMPVWASLVDPVADGLSAAIRDSMTSRLDDADAPDLQAMGLPAGMDLSMLTQQLAPFVDTMSSQLMTAQTAEAVGTLSSDTLTATEVGVPLLTTQVGLLPGNVAGFAEGLDVSLDEVWLHLAAREAARMRLFTAVPWIGPQILAAVQAYARGIAIDTDAIDAAVREIDPSDTAALQEALTGGFLNPSPTAAQRHALGQLETWLALVEGWVDHVAASATRDHLPHTAAMTETIRRRRATGGPAEKTFAALVGLELRPRRLRDAANLFAALEERVGASGRDGVWAHPDVAPTAADLDDVLGFVERTAAGGTDESADLDAALESILREADEGGSADSGRDPSGDS